VENFLGIPENDFSGFGQLDSCLETVKERMSKVALELSDLDADRGLGHPEFSCRLGKAPCLPNYVKIIEMIEI